MSIKRAPLAFEQNFVRIPNSWMRDARLSLRARGLLASLMTHQVGWKVSLDSLIGANPEGRDAIRGAITELKNLGYLRVTAVREKANGRMAGWDYELSDPAEIHRVTENPSFGESPTKKTSKSIEDQNPSKVDSASRPVHRSDVFASEAQVAFLADCYVLLMLELPDAEEFEQWRNMSSAAAHEEIRASWSEIEQGGDDNLADARAFEDHLSARAIAFIEQRLNGHPFLDFNSSDD